MTTGTNPTTAELVEAAKLWLKAGWHPIPLTGWDGKTPHVGGLTGYEGRDLTEDELEAAFSKPGVGALGIRMPPGVLGIDQDGYEGKTGPESVAALCEELGVELPAAPMISGRLDGRSGIRFFRVPPDLTWTADALAALGGGVELIHRGHRHAKAWPSVHHRTGMVLGRLDVEPGALVTHDDGGEPWLLPEPDELPDLPPELVGALTTRRAATGAREAKDWTNERGWDEDWAASVKAAWGLWERLGDGGRHGSMLRAQVTLVRLDSLGQAGATAALAKLKAEYVATVGGKERDGEAEYDRGLRGALAKVAGSQSYLDDGKAKVALVLGRLKARYEAQERHPTALPPLVGPVLPDAFWESRPTLAHIRQAARARRRSPDAVLGAVLARVAAIIPPRFQIPPLAGASSTLSFYVALVGPSGGGKTTAATLARELLPIPPLRKPYVVEASLGSGEGLVELYMGDIDVAGEDGKTTKTRGQVKDGAIVVLDEGQALTEMGSRKGSTTLPIIRTMWTGPDPGQSNATKENSRRLEPGGYTLGMVVGIQPTLTAELLADSAAGTPQRFIWTTIVDPGAPRVRPEWPGVLGWRPPPVPRDGRSSPSLIIDPQIVEQIDYEAWLKVKGDLTVDPLDSHLVLLHLKVAGLLALLDGRLDVTMDDWALATTMVETSKAVRGSIVDQLKADQALKEAAADARAARRKKVEAEAEAEVEQATVSKALEQAAGTVARKAAKVGRMDRRTAQQAIKSTIRKLITVDEALAYAVERGWLEVDETAEIWLPGIVND